MEYGLYECMKQAVLRDIENMTECGFDPEELRAELDGVLAGESMDRLAAFQQDLWTRPSPADFPYDEPESADAIRAGWPAVDEGEAFGGTEAMLLDKIRGGWFGRVAGCMLGKPIEMQIDWMQVRDLLEALGGHPLDDYMPAWDPKHFPEVGGSWPRGRMPHSLEITRGRIDHAIGDDDIDYAITALMCLEQYGIDFTAREHLLLIGDMTPDKCLWSSGKNGVLTAKFGLDSPETALFGNPTRQSLGAMIRCDMWGWASPGNPTQAAEMALRDGISTQTRNGIYAAVFWSVVLSLAFCREERSEGFDARGILIDALDYVPARSRFYEMVEGTMEVCGSTDDVYAIYEKIYERYSLTPLIPEGKRFNHCLINSALVITGLMKGGGDFSRTIGITVEGGRDTDCTGATAGSVAGVLTGYDAIPKHWTEPLRNCY
ncbi:MAG: ADP-ribosylglycohydrolase family protein, partial [Candidatus Sumerlaeia bacterium]